MPLVVPISRGNRRGRRGHVGGVREAILSLSLPALAVDLTGETTFTSFGPLNGADYVRDHAGPLAVSDPGGGVAFSPASDINALITANDSNTIFVASQTGTYNNFRGIIYSTKHPRFYFPGNALTDYNITGAGSLNEIGMNGNTNGLEIYGGKWTGYGSPASQAFASAIVAVGPTIIQDAFFTLNAQRGVGWATVANGDVFLAKRCKFLTNGRYHLSGGGNAGVGIHGQPILDSCLFDGANSDNYDPGGDAGCMKFNHTNGGIMRFCWSKNTKGFGAWFDGFNKNAHWHDNVVENNIGLAPVPGAGGMFYEVSGGGTIIEHNFITGNGSSTDINYPFNGVQLIVSCSPCDGTGPADTALNVRSEIRYNDIDTTNFQTPIVLYNHTNQPDNLRTRNWYAHHNKMTMRGASGRSRVGLADANPVGDVKEGDIGTSPGSPGLCLFDFNEYHVADINGAYWEHDTAGLMFPGARTWAQFRAKGHEANGTLVAI